MANNKINNLITILCFMLIITVPMFFTNFKENVLSKSEKRYLAKMPKLYDESGKINRSFISDFETWFNDNVGFREFLVSTNAKLQYDIFKNIERNDMHLGPNGELNYATGSMIRDYQHFNLRNDSQITKIVDSYVEINNYLKSKNIQFYYVQCWDKHSIYPEYFSKNINQYGEVSKTDQVINALKKTNVNVISFKELLINNKDKYDTYSVWGDPSHWTERGAYISYEFLMQSINKKNNNKFRILSENDYNIDVIDQGETLFNSIHEPQMLEKFNIKKSNSTKTNEKIKLFNDNRHSYYTNNNVDNNTRVVIIGDSYINSYILDDISQSFHETIMIWGTYTSNLETIVNTYNPDIIILEAAERVDRSDDVIKAAFEIYSKEN